MRRFHYDHHRDCQCGATGKVRIEENDIQDLRFDRRDRLNLQVVEGPFRMDLLGELFCLNCAGGPEINRTVH